MFENFFLTLESFEAKGIFNKSQSLWSPLTKIELFLEEKISKNKINSALPDGMELQTLQGNKEDPSLHLIFITKYLKLKEPFISQNLKIYMEKDVILEPTAILKPYVYIGKESEIRQGAYLRGNVIVGNQSVIGHATEVKNSIMMNHSEAGHFAYIGDSIIGSYVNVGAGVKLANLQFRSRKEKTEGFIREIKIRMNKKIIKTQMEKLGAIIGDFVEIGCNAVTCPGTLLEKNIQIFPNMNIPKGLYKENSMLSPEKN